MINRYSSYKSTIETNRQDSDDKMKKLIEDLRPSTTFTITSVMNQIDISKYSRDQKDSTKPQYPNTVVMSNSRYPSSDGEHSTKIGGMWNLKHETSSPKMYELPIKTEIKGDTALESKKF